MCIRDRDIGTTFGLNTDLVPIFENAEDLMCFSLNGVSMFPDSTSYCDPTLHTSPVESATPVQVFPNPTNGSFTLVIPGEHPEGLLAIFNMQGAKINEMQILQNEMQLDINEMPQGIYLLRVVCNETVYCLRVIKE
jgi:hypothetical protein